MQPLDFKTILLPVLMISKIKLRTLCSLIASHGLMQVLDVIISIEAGA